MTALLNFSIKDILFVLSENYKFNFISEEVICDSTLNIKIIIEYLLCANLGEMEKNNWIAKIKKFTLIYKYILNSLVLSYLGIS